MITSKDLYSLGFRPISISASSTAGWHRVGSYIHLYPYIDNKVDYYKGEVRQDPYPLEEENNIKWEIVYTKDELELALKSHDHYDKLRIIKGLKPILDKINENINNLREMAKDAIDNIVYLDNKDYRKQ